MTTLNQPAPRILLVDESGRITRPWLLYLQGIESRVGGQVGPSNDELAADLEALTDSSALGVFARQTLPLQTPPDVGYLLSFLRKPVESLPDDASELIKSRVFRQR